MAINQYPAPSIGTNRVQVITTTGTFTLPSGYGANRPLVCDIVLYGGGGGGGSGGNKNGTNLTAGGGGGGGSGFVNRYENVVLTSNASVVIGAGGNGASGVAALGRGNNGSNGGISSVNSTYFAMGGQGGGMGGVGTVTLLPLETDRNPYRPMDYVALQNMYANPTQDWGPGGMGGSGGAYGNGRYTTSTDIRFRGVGGSFGGDGDYAITSVFYDGIERGIGQTFGSLPRLSQSSRPQSQSFNSLIIYGGGGGGGQCDSPNTTTQFVAEGGTGGAQYGGISGRNATVLTSYAGTKNGTNGTFPTGGGGGGGGANQTTSGTGGNGAAGQVIIYYREDA